MPNDLRGLSPVQQYVEGTLLLQRVVVERLEKHADWLSAGAGAAILTLLSRGDLTKTLSESPQGNGFLLITVSLLFGAAARFWGYTASAIGDAGHGAIALTTTL